MNQRYQKSQFLNLMSLKSMTIRRGMKVTMRKGNLQRKTKKIMKIQRMRMTMMIPMKLVAVKSHL